MQRLLNKRIKKAWQLAKRKAFYAYKEKISSKRIILDEKEYEDDIKKIRFSLKDKADSFASLAAYYAKERKFNVFNSGYKEVLDWHIDIKSGHKYPLIWHKKLEYGKWGDDIKVPLEISKFHHLLPLTLSSLKDSKIASQQILEWIIENPVGYGPNWICPMQAAIRALNWIFFYSTADKYFSSFPRILKQSLKEHAKFIWENLEYSPSRSGNHYLSNLIGLLAIGKYIRLKESDDYINYAMQEIENEMRRTVLPDGSSYEASSNYHCLVTELFCIAAALSQNIPETKEKTRSPIVGNKFEKKIKKFSNEFYLKLHKMLDFAEYLERKDGTIFFYGDINNGRILKLYPFFHKGEEVFNRPIYLKEWRKTLFNSTKGEFSLFGFKNTGLSFEKAKDFPDSGVHRLEKNSVVIHCLCHEPGMNGWGGHNHNDNLSFVLHSSELEIYDPGMPCYTPDPSKRNLYRSTSMHSTWYFEKEQLSLSDGLFTLKDNKTLKPEVLERTNISWQARIFYLDKKVERRIDIGEPRKKGYKTLIVLRVDGVTISIADFFEEKGILTILSNKKLSHFIEKLEGAELIEDEALYSPYYGKEETCFRASFLSY